MYWKILWLQDLHPINKNNMNIGYGMLQNKFNKKQR